MGASTLTIGTGITIRGADLIIGENSATRAIINNGTIIATTAGEILDVTGVNWVNNGTLQADGGTLALAGSWTNASTIEAINSGVLNTAGTWSNSGTITINTNSTVNLAGSYVLADALSVNDSDGTATYNLQGSLNLLTGTFAPSATTGVINLDGVTMSNGTLADPLALGLPLTTNSTFNGMILAVDFTIPNSRIITVNSGNLTLANGVTLTLAGTGSTTRLGFGVDQSILSLGTSEIVATATSANTSIGQNVGASTLTIGTGITIRGADLIIGENSATRAIINNGTIIATTAGEILDVTGVNWVNNGTLQADGGTLALAGSWTNASTIEAINSGVLNTAGTWSNSGTITINTNSTVNLAGSYVLADALSVNDSDGTATYNLQGSLNLLTGTFAPSATTGVINLDGVTMSNGTLADPLALGLPLTTNSTFNGMILAVDFTIPNSRIITVNSGNLTLANGVTLTLAGTGSTTRLGFGVDQSILSLGTSEIVATATSANTSIGQNVGASTLTIGTGITIRGADLIIGENSATRAIINNGTIIATTAGEILDVTGVNWVNNGTLQADGGTLALAGSWTNASTIEAINSGVLNTAGTWSNSGTITINTNSTVNLAGSYVLADALSVNDSDGTATYNLQGSLNLLTGTFAPSATTGVINLDGVTMSNGTLADPLALGLPLTTNSTFNGMILAVDFTIPNSRIITVNSW